jgi:hypothetical protein
MTTIDRINSLLVRHGQSALRPKLMEEMPDLHGVLNRLDSAVGADTEWLSSKECGCLWHIGKTCHARRAVGARLRMLEEVAALNDLKKQFAV